MRNVIPIFFSIDKNVEMPCGVSITSLLENASPETFYSIYILHAPEEDYSQSLLNKLPSIYPQCSLSFISVGDAFKGAFEIREITRPAYFRLIAPALLEEYDKLIYYDVDMIFRRDLSPLWETDLGDNYLGAIDLADVLPKKDKDYVINNLGIEPEKGYFNSGALLINCAQIRKDSLMDSFLTMAKKDYLFQDQDILNLVCKGKILSLPNDYNLTNYAYEKRVLSGVEVGNSIIHYNGPKPWKDMCLNMDLWWYYYRKSIFFDERFTYNYGMARPSYLSTMPLKQRLKLLVNYFRQ